jgi:uncharacterized protein
MAEVPQKPSQFGSVHHRLVSADPVSRRRVDRRLRSAGLCEGRSALDPGAQLVDAVSMTTDRFGMEILSTNTCFDLLRSETVGRLAVSIRELPDIFPINFVVDHGSVVFRTAEGTKLAASVHGRGVAFEVDGLDAGAGQAWSVVLKGQAVEIERMYDLLDALDLPLFPWHASPKHRFVRIEPVEITGRRFHVVDPAVWSAG